MLKSSSLTLLFTSKIINAISLYDGVNPDNIVIKLIILVSHRLSSVGIADKIIFLEEGIVTGFGTHEALLGNCASYRSMVAVQEAISEGRAY